jgi:hypothetical protein
MSKGVELKSSATEQEFVSVKHNWKSAESNVLCVSLWTQTNMTINGLLGYESSPDIKYTQIYQLINFKYSLKKPITVKLIKTSRGEVIGDIEELELYSFGDNEFDVLRELNEELTDLFEDLLSISDGDLGKFPRKWKSLLKEYIAID